MQNTLTNDAYASFMEEWREKQAKVYQLDPLELDADSFDEVDHNEN
jgi:hypothetical protein